MTSRLIRKYCKLDPASEEMLEKAMTRLGLSARAYDRILKVSRTIADLEGTPTITMNHLQEAISYRELDKEEQWL
jgi:magnesium chelatase family protein